MTTRTAAIVIIIFCQILEWNTIQSKIGDYLHTTEFVENEMNLQVYFKMFEKKKLKN